MQKETLVEPFAAPEYFVDGFADHRVVGGNFFFCVYRMQHSRFQDDPVKVVVARFVCPVDAVPEGISRANNALLLPAAVTPIVGPLKRAH
jgi:hypothetical protein